MCQYISYLKIETQLLHCCEGMFTAPLASNRSPTVAWRELHRKHCYIVACWNVFTEPLPGNASQYLFLNSRNKAILIFK
jgi:hypothetical protein